MGYRQAPAAARGDSAARSSQLSHWPVQLSLIPPSAPFLEGADLLLTAQCAAFTMADFHETLLQRRPIAIASSTLFWMPRAMRSGATTRSAWAM